MLGNYLIRGLMIGLIFGVPAGAIGALTIQRTLNGGFPAGLATGLGSSAADLLYACVGAFGMTLVSGFLTRYQRPISLLGGLLIVALGIRIFRQKPQNRQQESSRASFTLCSCVIIPETSTRKRDHYETTVLWTCRHALSADGAIRLQCLRSTCISGAG